MGHGQVSQRTHRQKNREAYNKISREYYRKNREKQIKRRSERAREIKDRFLINLVMVSNDPESLFKEKRGENIGR